MSEVLDFYQKQAKAAFSHIPWVATLQEKGLQELCRLGFPNRHNEDWKYTLVDSLLKKTYDKPQERPSESAVASDIAVGHFISIQNGTVLGLEEAKTNLPAGVVIQPLFQALEEHSEKLQPYFDRLLKYEHGFHALNTALLNTGVVLYVPSGIIIDEPIVLSHWQDQEQASHCRYLIVLEEGSEATVIEDYHGIEGCNYFTNTVTEIFTGSNAKLVHYKIQREAKSSYHIGQTSVLQAKNSQFHSHSLSIGGKLVRSDIRIDLADEKAQALMNGIYAPSEGQHIDHHTAVHHLVPNCRSEQDYKGILTGRSRAVFNGKVIVAKQAQHSEARQQNKNLLLSNHAEIDSKPQLEIFADDVVCTHGATVGQLDEEALFYLATRGINREEASQYLIQAFTEENIQMISHPKLAEWMRALLHRQLR
ncbi:Fe-S cluster assembly protein SufD [Legionella jordanis]|uniref:Fe-S cluster assembly protein SufD n=1 Tax=Legionella jordanis TaxID=456 RepID=UPI000EFF2921|nr:Fe-S cluster assembly protein SufD [Legionella jordanis]RMX22081.1 Fe-S cluster assembly protein SufD [Legionella jordanis]HAT8712764.1 Fe-S cluster assembly protein SufD [Legionella jordanis]